MSGEPYEGFENRETWCLSLWLTNDGNLHELAREAAAKGDNREEALQKWVEQYLWPSAVFTDSGRAMVLDVGSLWRVNFQEVAASLFD